MNESNIGGISVRGIIAVIVLTSLSGLCVYLHTDASLQILKDMAILVLTFYFSQKSTQGGQNANTSTVGGPTVATTGTSTDKPATN